MERVLGVAAVLVLTVRPSLDMFSDSHDPSSAFIIRPASVVGIAVMLVAAFVGLLRLREGRPLWPDRGLRKAHYWLLAANLIGLVSGAWLYGAQGFSVGIREALRVLSTVAALLLVLWWVEDRPDRYRTGWKLLLLGTIPPIVAALVQWVTGHGYRETAGLNRLEGTFSHPLSLGPYLVPFILFVVAGLPSVPWKTRLLRGAFTVLMILVLTHTYSRTAVLVLCIAMAAFAVVYGAERGTRALVQALGLGAFVGALVVVFTSLPSTTSTKTRERFENIEINRQTIESAVVEGESENSFTWRLLNWSGLIRLGLKHPVAGHGLAMTTVLNPLVNIEYGNKPFNAHNDYVRFFFETGFSGLICYVMFCWVLCTWAWRRARVAAAPVARECFAIVGAVTALIVLSLGTTEFSSQTAVTFTVYGMLALLGVVPLDLSRADLVLRDAPRLGA
jgi:O-antigen ligase